VGTLSGVLRLKILIRTPPFLLGLSNKKSEGDVEMKERLEKPGPLYKMKVHSRPGENGRELGLALIIF
jgi:hypothetical protein